MVPPSNDASLLSGSTRVGLLLILLTLSSCAAPPVAEKNVRVSPEALPLPLAPNSCRFTGTVTEILPVDTVAERGACASVPCLALVRIDTVFGYGAAFAAPLSVGAILKIRFPLTLRPSRSLFPAMNDLPPSFSRGDGLTGTMIVREVPSAGREAVEYSIESYFATNKSESAR